MPVSPAAVRRLIERSWKEGSEALYRDALLYDHFYVRRRSDIEFYLQMAQRYSGPVLELGVGSGRVAIALAQAGFSTTGIDAMASMLAQARARAARLPAATQKRLALHRGDLRRLQLRRRFPLVIAPFNAFSHLYTRSDLERALATCTRHLRTHGRLVFDVGMPDLGALTQDPARAYRCHDVVEPRTRERFSYSEASHYDAVRQVRSMTLLLTGKHDTAQQRAIPLTHRQFFPAELEALLHYNGFEVEERFGDFDRSPLSDHSHTQIIVARVRRHLRGRRSKAPRLV